MILQFLKCCAQALHMEKLSLAIRLARPQDAAEIARVYIESWHDTYPGVIPNALLRSMTPRGQTARWGAAIRAQSREAVLVAENDRNGVVGMASAGPARDRGLGFDGEVYTLYVDPCFFSRGVGRALLTGSFQLLRQRGCASCVIWAHAKNNARFFYEAMGGRLIAERNGKLMGEPTPEVAFGWKTLALAARSPAR
jgi:ribosomal protein S18 acetylase RimI-like enzyme